ncbi:MAG: GGDEF domain-containing protein, partial [Pseudomonadota bacterium]|nr:GGDEF domain-containing protein [Pseudomonadota bacterium]
MKSNTFRIDDINVVTKAIVALAAVMCLHVSYLVWKIYIIRTPDLHEFVDLAVFFNEILVTSGIIFGFLILMFLLLLCQHYPKIIQFLLPCSLQYIAVTMSYQGYTFGSMSLPTGVMLVGATLIGFLLFDRRQVYLATLMASLILIGTTCAAIAGYLPYAPKLLDSNFPKELGAAVFLMVNILLLAIPTFVMIIFVSDRFMSRLSERTQQFKQLSQLDALTKVNNRLVVHEYSQKLNQQSVDLVRQHVIIMLDIDHFKTINDQFGHLIGDVVLQDVAKLLQLEVSHEHVVARFGGEEFIIILSSG